MGAPVKVVPKSSKWWDNYYKSFGKEEPKDAVNLEPAPPPVPEPAPAPAPEWKPNSINKEFWLKALVGRTIKAIEWDANGIECLVLDNGIKVHTPKDGQRMYLVTDELDQTTFTFTEATLEL